jgi:hypothetical protein|tara:strand:+ start:36 stop:257 length:222 start_codon:yes stop_codon:yes gene_type:complete
MDSPEIQIPVIPVASLSSDLRTNVCPKCKETSEEVLNMEAMKRVGWYCLKCHYFEEAILREITIVPTITKVHI